jgi:4-amino-4-deoxy-L-arabinose transferase-like glycosyltransferase
MFKKIHLPGLQNLAGDFRFWVSLFFILRLYGITLPPIETSHSWRQTFTCMVARNFLEEDPDIFYPRTDLAGSKTGIVACEFPIFNYLVFIAAKLFGYQHWYGRLINLIFSSIGIYAFFLIVKRYFSNRVALFSGIILLSSMWFMFSRKIMPDTFSVSLVLIGLWCLVQYVSTLKLHWLLFFFVFASLGGLSKIPATIVLFIGVIALFDKQTPLRNRVAMLAAFAAAGLVIISWYFIWEPYLLQKYQNQLYFPRGFLQGINDLAERWGWTIDKFTFVSLHSYVALFFFLTGIYYMIKLKNKLMVYILLVPLPLLFYFMIKSGYVFATHDYYVIPFVPVMALVAGYGLASFKWTRLARVFLIFIMIESMANQVNDFRLKKSECYLLNLENMADKVCGKNDLIAITGGLNPKEMYYAHRHGWSVSAEEFANPGFLKKIQREGCRFVFINRREAIPVLPYPVAYQDSDYIIYRVE